jgi:hypothetical protein
VTVEFAQSRFGKERVISSGILKTGRQTKKEIRDAVADWFLLGATDFIIGTYQSSFSDEAALLTSSQRKINIGPSNYSFHSILCFDAEGKAFERPQGEKDPCAPH